MDLNEYQEKAKTTAHFGGDSLYNILYCSLGVADEAGEVAGKVKKWLRDDDGWTSEMSDERREMIVKEMGDTLWYLSQLADQLGVPFSHVAVANQRKLADRRERDMIHGDGDER